MESEEVFKVSAKLKQIHVIQSKSVVRGLFRGLLVGMVFASVVTYIGFMDIKTAGDGELKDMTNSTIVDVHRNMATFLRQKVRVLCFITSIAKEELEKNGHMFLATWARKCDKFIFFVNYNTEKFKDHVVSVVNLREALAYIYKHHMDEFDWILRATDNSYVVMENLRWLLYQYEPDYPLIIGQRYLKEDYMKGIYAISKASLIRLIEIAFTNPEICDENGSDEDKVLSECLKHVNVIFIDGIDKNGRGMFFDNQWEALLFPEKENESFDKFYFHKFKQGLENCCSDRVIGMIGYRGTRLFYFEYFIYKVHAFGRHRMFEELPQKKSSEEILKEYNWT